MKIIELFHLMAKHNASDLHLKAGEPPIFRVNGQLARMQNTAALDAAGTEALLFPLMSEVQRETLARRGYEDFAYAIPDVGRFRCNIFRQLGQLSAAIRRVGLKIPTYEELRLPPAIARLAEYEQGLVLIGGVTGSGKSTTIASILNDINARRRCHILTIEDPVEYLFKDDKALVNQREMNIDVHDFRDALRSAVREDPDVMLLGEMRDAETFETALTAAETGHLVFGTVHASGAPQTIGRILDLFPEAKHEQIRTSLAFNLRCVLNQKLLKSSDKTGRVPAVETMFITPIIKKLILEREDVKIADALSRDVESGSENFNKALIRLFREKKITMDTALKAAPNPEELRMSMSGITISDGGIV
ncbi:MAG TPA: PilT/PilU family type 4a pilus ATPase [Planctomycetota bacterium]|nr:PilT/PilU family type 4a pilus ATPase [Planctomycetota bacterium]